MVRIIVNKSISGQNEFSLRIDSLPIFKKTADTYYLFDYLEISDQELKDNKIDDEEVLNYAIIKLIDDWNNRVNTSEKGDLIFLPFDFQDEYISGILLKEINGRYKVRIVYTSELHGHEVNKTILNNILSERTIQFLSEENQSWNITCQQFNEGLEWSKNELKKQSK